MLNKNSKKYHIFKVTARLSYISDNKARWIGFLISWGSGILSPQWSCYIPPPKKKQQIQIYNNLYFYINSNNIIHAKSHRSIFLVFINK